MRRHISFLPGFYVPALLFQVGKSGGGVLHGKGVRIGDPDDLPMSYAGE